MDEAEAARQAGDLPSAFLAVRAALDLCPMNKEAREALADLLLDDAERRAARAAQRKAKDSTRVLREVEDDPEEAPAPKPARRRPSTLRPAAHRVVRRPLRPLATEPLVRKASDPKPEPKPFLPPKPAFKAVPEDDYDPFEDELDAEHEALAEGDDEPLFEPEIDDEPPPVVRRGGFLGFADLDRQEIARPPQIKRPREPKSRRAPRHRTPMFKARTMVLAGFWAGALLVVVGLSHAMISSLLAAPSLPSPDALAASVPAELTAILRQSESRLMDGEIEAALVLLRRANEDFPGHTAAVDAARVLALRALAARELDGRDYAAAAAAYREAISLAPQQAANWIDLARVHREHGRSLQPRNESEATRLLELAREGYLRALELRKDDPSALLGLAQTYTFLGRRAEAVEHYDRVVSVAPESAESRLARQHLAQLRGG